MHPSRTRRNHTAATPSRPDPDLTLPRLHPLPAPSHEHQGPKPYDLLSTRATSLVGSRLPMSMVSGPR